MFINKSDIENIKSSANILDIIGQYVMLKPSGPDSFKGLCPFHNEKTPTFFVNPLQGYYYCFGCGEGGNIFKFLQNYENISFIEAVVQVAERIGYKLQKTANSKRYAANESNQILYEINYIAKQYFINCLKALPSDAPAFAELYSRGFNRSNIEFFEIGYAQGSWHGLKNHLLKKGFLEQDIIRSGLLSQSQGSSFDRFRNRLIWPIYDLLSRIVGFGARALNSQDIKGAKYINTPETPIYHKSHILYGLNFAKKDIMRKGAAIITEGYTDVMAFYLSGFKNALAVCGTSFGKGHAELLRRLLNDNSAAQIIFCFDGDSAGIKAAFRILEFMHLFSGEIYIALNKNNLDPCDIYKQDGQEGLESLIKNKTPLLEFIFAQIVHENHSNNISLSNIKNKCFDILLRANIKDAFELEKYIDFLSRILIIDKDILQKSYMSYRPAQHLSAADNNSFAENISRDICLKDIQGSKDINQLDILILQTALKNPDIFRQNIYKLKDIEPKNPYLKDIYKNIIAEILADNSLTLHKLIENMQNKSEYKQLLNDLIFSPMPINSRIDQNIYFDEIIQSYIKQHNSLKMHNLLMSLKKAEAMRDKDEIIRLNREIMQLNQQNIN